MKKIFFFAAALVAAITVNAKTIVDEIRFTGEPVAAGAWSAEFSFTGENEFIEFITNDQVEKMAIDSNSAWFGATEETKIELMMRLKTGGKSQKDPKMNQIEVSAYEDGVLTIYARTGSNSATDRNLVLAQDADTLLNVILLESDAKTFTNDKNEEKKLYPIYTANLKEGDYVITYPIGAIYFYGFDYAVEVDDDTAVDNVTASAAKAKKIVENGQIYILKNGVKFNVLGAQVK